MCVLVTVPVLMASGETDASKVALPIVSGAHAVVKFLYSSMRY